MFIGIYNKSIILTFIGLFCCVIGISFCFEGNILISSILLVIAGICDCFDGYVASKVKRTAKEKQYGIELDSLVDAVCFGMYPIVIATSLGYTSIINMIIYCIYIFCGITRLGYFNVDEENTKHFKGLPITTMSFILPIILIFTQSEIVLMITFLLVAILFITNIKINKVDLKTKKLFLLTAIIIIALLILSKI